MMTPDKRFYESIFRTVYGRWPKPREFQEWNKRLVECHLEDWCHLFDACRSLEKAGLYEYAREVYWTSIALLMKKHDEENRDE